MLDFLRYATMQTARVGWYTAQYAATRREVETAITDADRRFVPEGDLPGEQGLRQGLIDLFRRDWENVKAGHYPRPEGIPSPTGLARRLMRYLGEVPTVTQRRVDHGHSDVLTDGRRSKYPRYYLQNFHYQSDGWLSDKSARLYDDQVEVLFTGSAAAMRRQGIPLLKDALSTVRNPRLLDIATGTGTFLKEFAAARPDARLAGLDLSRAYLKEAARKVPSATFIEAKAEALPLASDSLDAVSAVYLFHELPPKVRVDVAKQIARVLKPGGVFLMIDSLQTGDRSDYDGLLEYFPRRFHEPYYADYTRTDLAALFGTHGLAVEHIDTAFFSKIMLLRKIPREGA